MQSRRLRAATGRLGTAVECHSLRSAGRRSRSGSKLSGLKLDLIWCTAMVVSSRTNLAMESRSDRRTCTQQLANWTRLRDRPLQRHARADILPTILIGCRILQLKRGGTRAAGQLTVVGWPATPRGTAERTARGATRTWQSRTIQDAWSRYSLTRYAVL